MTGFVLDVNPTDFTIEESFVSQATSDLGDGSDFGSWDANTFTWTGNLKQNDSIGILFKGSETAPLGSTINIDTEIVSSELAGSVVNSDPNAGNDTANISYTSVADSNLNVSTRLKTGGTIIPSTSLTYEVTVENVGPGAYVDNGFFQLVFVVPEDATFVETIDLDTGDDLDLLGCFNIGPLSNLGFQALNTYEYTGDAVACGLQASSGLGVGTTFKFDFNMTAGTSFAAGNAEVIVLVQGNDADSYSVFPALAFNTDPLEDNNGNSVYLSYDPTVLAATASLCPGQGTTSTDGTACFRISFNKDIVEETFSLDDITVSGSGTASSLTKVGNNLWELRIVGIAQGATSSISLQTNDIVDFSAVESSVSVLGINTIRFEAAAQSQTPGPEAPGNVNSAVGTLANTGSSTNSALIALTLLLAGFALSISSRKKRTHA